MALKVVVYGAGGRMGKTLVRLIAESSKFDLVGAVERENFDKLGEDAGVVAGVGKIGVKITDDQEAGLSKADAVIDFTSPDATVSHLESAQKFSVPMVIGTTGLNEARMSRIREASNVIPIVMAPNFSIGVNVLLKVVEVVSEALGSEWEVEIMEIHHHGKKDAPSGTAKKLAEIVRKIRGGKFVYGREGIVGERNPDEIGVMALRGGDVVGEHTVYFFGAGERLELSHRATTREIFARGALRAVEFVVGKPPRLYSMEDVLFGDK